MRMQTQSTEPERQRAEAQRNLQRRHDFYMRWFMVRPLAAEIPAVMNWRWHRESFQVAGSISGRISSFTQPHHIEEMAR